MQQDFAGFFQPPAGVLRHAPGGQGGASLSSHVAVEGIGELLLQRSWKARHYRLTLRKDGMPVVTIPLRGNEREALRFAGQHAEWLGRARERQLRKPRVAAVWILGTEVLWRGEMHPVRLASEGHAAEPGQPARPSVCLAADVFRVPSLEGDLRATLEAHFARRAKIELPGRTWELAAQTQMDVKQVTVRNQRSRWGSCSSGGVISLNWRLIQTPDFVRDYIIYHELSHLREMNHSSRFWDQVERLCPGWRAAERWLKLNSGLLGL